MKKERKASALIELITALIKLINDSKNKKTGVTFSAENVIIGEISYLSNKVSQIRTDISNMPYYYFTVMAIVAAILAAFIPLYFNLRGTNSASPVAIEAIICMISVLAAIVSQYFLERLTELKEEHDKCVNQMQKVKKIYIEKAELELSCKEKEALNLLEGKNIDLVKISPYIRKIVVLGRYLCIVTAATVFIGYILFRTAPHLQWLSFLFSAAKEKAVTSFPCDIHKFCSINAIPSYILAGCVSLIIAFIVPFIIRWVISIKNRTNGKIKIKSSKVH